MVASARVGHAGKAPGLRRLVGPTTVRATATIVATATGAAPIAIVRTEEEAIAGGPTPVAPATGAGTPEAVIGIADMQNDATTAIDADMATDHARMTGIDRGSRTVRTAVDATRAGATVAVSTIGSLVRTARAQAAPARAAPAANETGTETARTAAATPAVAASVNAIAISTGTGTATGTATGIGTGTATPTGPRAGADSGTGRGRTSRYRRRSSAVIRRGSRASRTARFFRTTSTRAASTARSGSSCGPWPAASPSRCRYGWSRRAS
jgi:hypothetical protein